MNNKKVETDPCQQIQSTASGATGKCTDSIVTNLPTDVKPNLRELALLREHAKIKATDMVEVVRGIYPRYDKYIHSKCENGKEYGIQLRPDAMNALVQRFAPELQKKPRKPNRSKPNRIQARLSDDVYAALQQLIKAKGVTVQQLIERLVLEYLSHSDSLKGDSHEP